MNLWLHQERALADILEAITQGHRRILLQCPTGGGKTKIMELLARHFLEQNQKVILYSHRRALIDQLIRVMRESGMNFGVRAAGHTAEDMHNFQISSLPTEHSRTTKRKTQELHDAALILVDEARLNCGRSAKRILDRHLEEQYTAVLVGFDATPVGCQGVYDRLVTAGTTLELRTCGALVLAHHFAYSEPDLKGVKVAPGADLSEQQQRRVMGFENERAKASLMGSIWDGFETLNQERRPTILFAPGVAESLWIAEQFWKKGVTAAHIDGERIWCNGDWYASTTEARDEILAESRSGRLVVLCNRYVLREGIDAPWLSHGIFATVFGSLASYLQAGGRLLRAYHDLEAITLQDHGGNWWRHGSLNANREWRLDETPGCLAGLRADRLRGKRCWKCKEKLTGPCCFACGTMNEYEPCCCPKCHRVIQGMKCSCGWERGPKTSRPVITREGVLKEVTGDIYKPRAIYEGSNAAKKWEKLYWAGRTPKWNATFAQVEAMFAKRNQDRFGRWQYPPRDLPMMPKEPKDFFRKCVDVPFADLIPKPPVPCEIP